MDGQRFDGIVRALGAQVTRRRGFAAALGALATGLAAGAEAKPDGRGRGNRRGPATSGPCGDGSARANRCRKDRKCCTKYCSGGTCRCKPNYMDCKKAEECCAGRCVNGKCDGGAKPAGSACRENFNCKSGLACIGGVCKASGKASCTAANCPGCCEGTTCRAGSDRTACGPKGGACVACATGQTCDAGVCKAGGGGGCSAATCPNGCCENNVCKPGTEAAACGTGGDACEACTGGTPNCTSQVCAVGVWTAVAAFGSASFNKPSSIAVTSDDLKAFITDTDNNKIGIWTRPDAASTTWSELTTLGDNTFFNKPFGIAAAADGKAAYITDSGNSGVSVWVDNGLYWLQQTTFPVSTTVIPKPKGIFVTPDQLTLWVTDWDNDAVSQWSRPDTSSTSWTQDTSFGSFGTGGNTTNLDKFDNPTGISLSSDLLTAVITDRSNARVTVWTRPDTQATSTWTPQAAFGANEFDWPHGVAVSPDGLVAYIADYNHFKVQVWSRPDDASTDWAYLTEFGEWGDGTSLGHIQYPTGLAVSADGQTAWVVDSSLNRVTVWTYA